MKERREDVKVPYRIELVVEITPSPFTTFRVVTWNVRIFEDEGGVYFTQGNGFKREVGVLTSSELISSLLHTEEPFQVRLR